jgi:coproporphyrinogen III oxidase-like Fe-S oxidoreductase
MSDIGFVDLDMIIIDLLYGLPADTFAAINNSFNES